MNDRLSHAQLLIQQGRFKDAEKILKDLISQFPNDSYVLSTYAQVCLELENLDQALELINSSISLNPQVDFQFYIKSRIQLRKKDLDAAESSIQEAILLDPSYGDYYAFKGHIQLLRKNFDAGLDLANHALSLDPKNEFALNVRSSALLKLGREEESYETIKEALNEDPNNSYTHANLGWNFLEKGKIDPAMKHFKESLKNDPSSAYARAGMVEALKSKHLIYRAFMRYSFWMSKQKGNRQWLVIIGFYLLMRGSSYMSENESLKPFFIPLTGILILLAISSWLINPITGLFIRFNKSAKHMLSEKETRSSNLIAISLGIAIIGLILYLFIGKEGYLSLVFFGVLMLIPLGSLNIRTTKKNIFPIYTLGLTIVGFLGCFIAVSVDNLINLFALIFAIGIVAFQWLSNFVMIREDNP